jgi:hypothetical protein
MMVALGANAEEHDIEGALHAQEILDRMDASASVLAAGYYFRTGDSPGGSPSITTRASVLIRRKPYWSRWLGSRK